MKAFSLLEVLLAISLLTLCGATLIRQPILMHRAEISQLERLEADRIASWTFTEIHEKFLKGSISWAQIPPLQQKSKPFPMSDVPFQIPPLVSRSAKRSFIIETLKEKKTQENQIARLISVHILIQAGSKNRQFSYQLNVLSG